MGDGWYVSRAGSVFGPYSWERMLELAREGSIGAEDRVKRPGSDEWVPVADVPAFVAGTVQVTRPSNGEAAGGPAAPEAPAATAPRGSAPRARRRRLPAVAAIAALAIAGVAVGAPLAFDTGSGSDASGGIIFSRMRDGGQHIYVMGADGSNPRPITDSELGDTHPSASPDGGRIVFVRGEKGLMLLDGGKETQLTKDDVLQPLAPVWSPDGARIYYSRQDGAGEDAPRYIYSMKADGTDDRKVSPAFSGTSGSDDDPALSSDGKTLVFVTTRRPDPAVPGWALGKMPAAGGAITFVAGTAKTSGATIGGPSEPAWSPSQRIVFSAHQGEWSIEGRAQIYVMNADGSGKTQITSDKDGDRQDPVWSPDGKRIVFAKGSSGRGPSIWAVDAAGGNEQALTEVSATDGDFSPSFLPESGALIAGHGGSGGGESSGLGGRIGRIPAWWGERPAAVSSWVRIVLGGDGPPSGTEKAAQGDDKPPLGTVQSWFAWVGVTLKSIMGDGGGGGNEYQYWSGDTPETIYRFNMYGERAGKDTGKPWMRLGLRKTADGSTEVAEFSFGVSEYDFSEVGNLSDDYPRPGIPMPGIEAAWGEADQRLGLKPNLVGLVSYSDRTQQGGTPIRWVSRDSQRFTFIGRGWGGNSKGYVDLNEWDFRLEGAPGSEVFVVGVRGMVVPGLDWENAQRYETAADAFHMTRKY